jgi:excisionase family DNA binding protein
MTRGLREDPKRLATRRDVAAYLNVSVRTFARHVERELPYIRIGTLVRFEWGDVDAWVAANTLVPYVPSVPTGRAYFGRRSSAEVKAANDVRARLAKKARYSGGR